MDFLQCPIFNKRSLRLKTPVFKILNTTENFCRDMRTIGEPAEFN